MSLAAILNKPSLVSPQGLVQVIALWKYPHSEATIFPWNLLPTL